MRKVIFGLIVCGLLFLLWYLFIRSYEFEVKFKAQTIPGDIIETARIWDRSYSESEIVAVDSVSGLTQMIERGDRKYVYDWSFDMMNDSTTQVNIAISQPGNGLKNKMLIPFTEQPIETDAEEVAREFYNILQEHLKITAVEIVGEANIEEAFCVCTTLKTKQTEKAFGMMKDYGLISSFVGEFGLEADGPPLVRVNSWNHGKGELNFDFCFPIVKQDTLPESKLIKYETIEKRKAIKAVYNGNYITSDRAWYQLMVYAERNGYEPDGYPVEYFYNNPNVGGNEEEWKAEVYLPVK